MSRLLATRALSTALLLACSCTAGSATRSDAGSDRGGAASRAGSDAAGSDATIEPVGGTGGAAGQGQGGATSAGGAAGGTTVCLITASSSLSAAIPTVGIVTWSTTLPGLTAAEIDFGRSSAGPSEYVAPVDLTEAGYRTLLLGMKGSTSYTFRIVARSGATSCTSQDYTMTTGALPSNAPKLTTAIANPSTHDRGFIVTTSGLVGTTAFILDADGEVVWWTTAPATPSRAHLSWDGKRMYMMTLNVQNSGAGNIESLAMDGTDLQTMSGMAASHHDLVAIPGGFATLLWNMSGTDAPCSVVERQDGTGKLTTVEADMGAVYNSSTFHTNSIHYSAVDDSYTVGDRVPSLYVKIGRSGSLIWQFGGSNPKDASKFFSNVPTWMVNHGHHLTADGAFLFFNNGAGTNGISEAWEYQLDTATMTATKTWTYSVAGARSAVLGDVQLLPDGNVLVTYSTTGQIHEVDPSGNLVMKISGSSLGYSEFRESIYGPPPY